MSKQIVFNPETFKNILRENNISVAKLIRDLHTNYNIILSERTIRRACNDCFMSMKTYQKISKMLDISECVVRKVDLKDLLKSFAV